MLTGNDWLWWTGAGVLGVIALVLLVWALFLDRSRGRRRCPKCWYDMSGTDALTCSECGKTVKHEKKLHKTRRRKRWAVLAIIMLAGSYMLWSGPKVREHGWVSILPATALIFLDRYDNERLIKDEMARRMRVVRGDTGYLHTIRHAFYDWQWQVWLDRCYEDALSLEHPGRAFGEIDHVIFFGTIVNSEPPDGIVDDIIAEMKSPKYYQSRKQAQMAIVSRHTFRWLGERSSDRIVEIIIHASNTRTGEHFEPIVNLLRTIPERAEELAPYLIALANRAGTERRSNLTTALVDISEQEHVDLRIFEPLLNEVVPLLRSDDSWTRIQIATLLINLGPVAEPILDEVRNTLSTEPDSFQRSQLRRAIEAIRSEK